MERLSDFKPLETVELPDIGKLQCSGLIMIVGPNSAGKTQFLQDMNSRLTGRPRNLVVAKDVRVTKPDFEPLMRCLQQEGYFKIVGNAGSGESWVPSTTYVGLGQQVEQISPSQARNWYGEYDKLQLQQRNEFLYYFGRLLVTVLFLDRRLISLNQTAAIDYHSNPPQHDLHALYMDDVARQRFFEEMQATFGRAVWPDSTQGVTMCLRVSDEGNVPTTEDRLSPKRMAAFRTIDTEGDGLRSYAAVCVALLLGRRPVCLIDEPEMCLHPPQAYNLGRFIGLQGSSPDTATFVATHSSEVLRGVIQTAKDVQIVRLRRREGHFSAHLLPPDILKHAIAKPAVRAEAVLDGIFAQSVVVVEADGDRLVYQTTWETLAHELRQDVHFTTVGGKGGLADTCNLYRRLRIPIAAIADLDLLADAGAFRNLLSAMTSAEQTKTFEKRAADLIGAVGALPPAITESEIRGKFENLLTAGFCWDRNDDIRLATQLNSIARRLDRQKRIKRGLAGLPRDITTPLSELISDLRQIGVFVVPVGELENWLPELPQSKENKWAWANAAALDIQAKGALKDDVWDFVRAVGGYLSRQ